MLLIHFSFCSSFISLFPNTIQVISASFKNSDITLVICGLSILSCFSIHANLSIDTHALSHRDGIVQIIVKFAHQCIFVKVVASKSSLINQLLATLDAQAYTENIGINHALYDAQADPHRSMVQFSHAGIEPQHHTTSHAVGHTHGTSATHSTAEKDTFHAS
jgi:hypothetical protein